MKPYNEHIQEITSEEIFKGLLCNGLFNNKIPPFLTNRGFFNYFNDHNPAVQDKWRDYIRYENIRNINVPRQLGIPNPFAYAKLCKHIGNKWDKFQEYFDSKLFDQSHKISRVHIRKMQHNDSLFEMNYKNFDDDGWPENDLLVKSNYLVHADISNCFPSIYTHSVPWALAGKDEAKRRFSRGNLWYNQLDKYLRINKNGETNGILIGPHSSNLISEIILVAVDKKLNDKGYKFIRHIDDYSCYVFSVDDAENFLIDLSVELKEYQLELNHKKTEILPLPLYSEKEWLRKLKRFQFSSRQTEDHITIMNTREVFSYLDLALELMMTSFENRLEILNYAIKNIASKHLNNVTREHYLKRIHHLVLIYPYLVQVLEDYIFVPFETSIEIKREISNDLFELGVNKKLFEPSIYALYYSIKYNLVLETDNLSTKAIGSNDCIFMLLAYLYDRSKHNPVEPYRTKALDLKQNDFDRYWIFIYEVLEADDFAGEFREIKNRDISFVKEEFR